MSFELWPSVAGATGIGNWEFQQRGDSQIPKEDEEPAGHAVWSA
jgi:hypothetical protein